MSGAAEPGGLAAPAPTPATPGALPAREAVNPAPCRRPDRLVTPVTLSWKSFTAAADQAGISREYGGIQFNDGDFEARQTGEDVGLLVWSKAKSYFNGKAIPKTSTKPPASLPGTRQ
jgi:hypothetical protein